ncbi:hypothetical protein [Rubellimicrobium roseum]|uniref:Uncharacterized protein n=1 Tax=Rubellimicrobium roseum TaxID=687525 RepID=A0A5C4NA83_9RHOB|nr:hypothetical protein [Rubellimicrobium roseum]TNC71543.1 hypothetical protein FHG71_11435 [Rubellimicrobium roseum]
MATRLGPHPPKKGWALRWTRQAASLLLATPMAFLALATAILTLGALGEAARHLLWGPGEIAAAGVLTALAILPAVTVSNLILMADGRGRRSLTEIWDIARPLLLPALALAGAQALMNALLPGGPAPVDANLPETWRVAQTGLALYAEAAALLAVLNVFWLGSAAALGLRPAEAWTLQELLSRREASLFLTLLLMTLALGKVLAVLHPLLGLVLLLAYQTWNYVAGREVLGGLDGNGTPETSPAARAQAA